jgi:pyridoxal phosphate enzyme (YggS family)
VSTPQSRQQSTQQPSPQSDQSPKQRRDELNERWQTLLARVAAAAQGAGRDPAGLTVIAVTKTWPAADISHLRALGIRDFGENRAQELATKLDELGTDGSHISGPGLRWHFLGQLQRNKAGLVGRSCAALHTLDRAALIAPLSAAAQTAGRQLDVFVQLSIDGDPQRGGVGESELALLADQVAAAPQLRLRGLMTVPPLGTPSRPAFARLREVSERLRQSHPEAVALSAGMSKDFEDAVKEGATHLRVGTVLLGSRA